MGERRKESKLKDFCTGFGSASLGLIFLAAILSLEGAYRTGAYLKTLHYRIP